MFELIVVFISGVIVGGCAAGIITALRCTSIRETPC